MELIGYEVFERLDYVLFSILFVGSCFVFSHLVFSTTFFENSIAIRTYIQKQGNRYWWFPLHPNNISYSRIAFVIVCITLLAFGKIKTSAAIFVFSVYTDYLDGIIARKCNLITPLGKKLDPLADKILTIPLLLFFCYQGILLGFLIYPLVALDLAGQFLVRPILKKHNKTEAANYWGKIKTVLILILLLFCFVKEIIMGFPIEVLIIFSCLSLFFSFMSFFSKIICLRN